MAYRLESRNGERKDICVCEVKWNKCFLQEKMNEDLLYIHLASNPGM